MPADTLQALAFGIASAFRDTFDNAGSGEEATESILAALGWEMPPGVYDLHFETLNPSRLFELVGKLNLQADTGEGDTPASLQLRADLLVEALAFLDRLRSFSGHLSTTLNGAGDYLSRTRIDQQFGTRLIDLVIIRFLERRCPILLAALLLLGIVRLDTLQADASVGQIAHVRHTIDLSRLGIALTDLPRQIREQMGWGTPDFKLAQFVSLLGYLLQQLGLPGALQRLPRRVEERLTGVPAPAADDHPMPKMQVSFAKTLGWNRLDIGVAVYGLRPTTSGGADAGFGLSPFVRNHNAPSLPLTERLSLNIEGLSDIAEGTALLLRPTGFALKGKILSGGALTNLAATVALGITMTPPSPMSLLALPGGSRLEIGGLTLRAGGQPQPFAEVVLHNARFVFSLEGGGGLFAAILPKDAFAAQLDLAVGCAEGRFYLRGSPRLEVSFPVQMSFGPVDVQAVTLALSPHDSGLPIEVSSTLRATLGPLMILVERIGLTATLSFPPGSIGNFGPLDVRLGPKWPTGLAVELNAGPVTGGGYLSIDIEGKRYGGMLHLKLSFIDITAYGLYESAPDGGASFVAVLGIRFTPGIQLSFGFVLTGVGGLVGIQRRANVDALRNGLASGASGNVLFGDDQLYRAPALLADLAAFFPAAPSGFLVGPTLQIGWLDSPRGPLVRLDVGIVLEFPGPSKVLVIGSLRSLVGIDETLALLFLRMDFIGGIDFSQQLIFFDAQLVNSSALGIFRLTGGAALRVGYGSPPFVVLTVGGFHPAFDPAPLRLPVIPRVGASLDASFLARVYLRLEMYFAITSNTLQTGAHVQAGMSLGPLSADGHFDFDALLQFRPFWFEADFSAGFAVRALGISFASVDINGHVSGPGPIVIHAEGSVRRLGVKVSGNATFELGERNADTPVPIPSLVQALKSELSSTANLRSSGEDSAVVLASPRHEVPVGAVVVSPRGGLVWEQKRAPLKTLIQRLEGTALEGPAHTLSVSAPAGWVTSDELDWFSPGSFTTLDLKSSQMLNNSTFQELPSGLRLGAQVDVRATRSEIFDGQIDLVKQPGGRLAGLFTIGAYMTTSLTSALRERSTTPDIDAGPPKVSVSSETFDVHDVRGTQTHSSETPFQAFQLSRMDVGRIAVPSADVMVAL